MEVNLSGDWRARKSAGAGDLILCGGAMVRVIGVKSYPPGQHPEGAPIVADLHAVEIITPRGSRWAGAVSAPRIGSDLRMQWGGLEVTA